MASPKEYPAGHLEACLDERRAGHLEACLDEGLAGHLEAYLDELLAEMDGWSSWYQA